MRQATAQAGFAIRAAKPADAAAILEMESQFPSDRMSLRSIRHFLRASSAQVWMAFTPDDTAVGCLILLTRRGSRVARIYSVVVVPAARGRGLAARLVTVAETAARRHGCRRIALEVRQDNAAARSLYARLGYAETATLPGYYDDGADGLRLARELRRPLRRA